MERKLLWLNILINILFELKQPRESMQKEESTEKNK